MLIFLVTAIDCLALFTFFYVLFAFRDHRRRRGFPYPPGPPPLPVIGNLLDVPKLSPWLGYANISKKYGRTVLSWCLSSERLCSLGDVVCLQIFGQVVIVLCSPTAIKDLFEKRGELYADRTPFPVFEPEMFASFSSFPHRRRLLNRSLRPGATALDQHLIEEKTRAFLSQLLATPKAFRKHLHLLQGKIVMRLTYGYDLKENDDMLAPPKRVVEIMTQFTLPGAALVNHLPFLRRLPSWVPWFKYEPLAGECRELGRRMKNEPMDFVRNSMREGTAIPSLATEFLQDADPLSGMERQQAVQGIENILGSLFQEVQKRAQAELDSVISRDRLPTYDDRPRLPYIEAMSKELMRWHMVTPLGVPHSPTDDDFYKGYFIPKGAVVIANGWAVLHDPELYPDPEAFNPSRFLNEDGAFRDDPMISLAFGAGRRICPSRHLVDMILFVVTASVLSVFNVRRAKDKDGNDIPVAVPPLESVLPDVTVWVPGFECGITPRDKIAEDLIRASAIA
ncbi:cytochrome P450 [Lactarius vividus]|nr:cytochrome P450 [Lactarius vividus]